MKVKTPNSRGTLSERLMAALQLPSGARFYRCALQVNPFAYLSRHSKQTSFRAEAEYNTAIIAACRELGIEVIGVTDHYRVAESKGLVQAARAAGLFAFSGFEAVTKDGVHFLCLFDPEKDSILERFIGECGIRDSKQNSPTGSLDSDEVDPIVWTEFRRFLAGAAGCPGGGPKAAIHSGLDSALGSHPCVALSSYQAPPLYGTRG